MNKWLKMSPFFAACIAAALSLVACGDDNHKKSSFCDLSFHEGCEDGYYLYCEREESDSNGKIVSKSSVTIDKYEYVCNDDNKLIPANLPQLSCENSRIYDSERVDVTFDGYCDGNNVLRCGSKGIFVQEACASGQSCVEIERGEFVFAQCIANSNVSSGCSGTTSYGSCGDDDSLTFCTSRDPAKGRTVRLDCASEGMVCRLIEESSYGYDCTTICHDNNNVEYTAHGTCQDNTLTYCHEGVATPLHCGDLNKTCAFDVYQYDCVNP